MSATLTVRPSSSRPRSISLRAPAPIMLRADCSGTGGRPFAVEHEVERADQVGRGIDQRAVEIEYDNAGKGHGRIRYRPGRIAQVGDAG